jgi:hypothetical protein
LLYPPPRHPIFEAAGRRGALASSEAMHAQHDRDQGKRIVFCELAGERLRRAAN